MTQTVRLEKITKRFEQKGRVVEALSKVSLGLAMGQLTVLMGPSGSGKTTLLKIIGLMERPTSGDIWVHDQKVSELSAADVAEIRRENIGFMFQDAGLINRMSVLANTVLPLWYRGVGVREREMHAKDLLAQMGLEQRMSHTPDTLSGGEQLRVGLARALITNPKIIVCDEPTAALDKENSLQAMSLLRKAARDGVTIIVASHDPLVAQQADQLLGFEHGAIISQGQMS